MKKTLLTLSLVGLALAGCSGMSPQQCSVADWRAVGYEDGARGRPETYLAERADRCFDSGAPVNRTEYAAGRVEGLAAYCTPETGHAVGRAGAAYQGVCEGEAEHAFLKAYAEGRRYYASGVRGGWSVGVGSGGGWGVGVGFPIWYDDPYYYGGPYYGGAYWGRPYGYYGHRHGRHVH